MGALPQRGASEVGIECVGLIFDQLHSITADDIRAELYLGHLGPGSRHQIHRHSSERIGSRHATGGERLILQDRPVIVPVEDAAPGRQCRTIESQNTSQHERIAVVRIGTLNRESIAAAWRCG
jgi:hypothetical protein